MSLALYFMLERRPFAHSNSLIQQMHGCMTICHSEELLFLEFDRMFKMLLRIDQGLHKTEHIKFFGHKKQTQSEAPVQKGGFLC